MTSRQRILQVGSGESLRLLIAAAGDMTHVTGLTHNYYRYPARFSPHFVRAAIEAFSSPGDLVLDPFMGGGTTLVEAMALGRDAIGIDISTLAGFVSAVKTTIYSTADLQLLRRWIVLAARRINMHAKAVRSKTYAEAGYYRNLQTLSTWRLRKAIEQALSAAQRLNGEKLEAFARCAILRSSQWAIDGRYKLPSIEDFRANFVVIAEQMIEGAEALRNAVLGCAGTKSPSIRCLTRSTDGVETDPAFKDIQRPKLVLTSPPYPGLHVLYHRWQVSGGKEIPAPFWIANKLDGSGEAFYTFGDRGARELHSYFENLRATLRSVVALCSIETTIVQVVAFSQPSWQLPRYLAVADDLGLCEFFLPDMKGLRDGRLWRSVPNRKWYADQRGKTHGSQEVVLFHRIR
jgi:hypothetical protein